MYIIDINKCVLEDNNMVFDKKRAFYVLRQMSFERIAGTEKELEAANILKGECEKVGIPLVIEDFEIDDPLVY